MSFLSYKCYICELKILSRFTKELPQTIAGYVLSQGSNMIGDVQSVSYYDGATVVQHWSDKWGAFTIGSYINGDKNIKADPYNYLFQHEYGHYLQSQSVGPTYLFNYAIPSLIDAAKHDQDVHDYFWVEMDANARALRYWKANIPDYDMSQWYNPIEDPSVIHYDH